VGVKICGLQVTGCWLLVAGVSTHVGQSYYFGEGDAWQIAAWWLKPNLTYVSTPASRRGLLFDLYLDGTQK